MSMAAAYGNPPSVAGGQQGFSLIEVLVALTILALGAGALIGAGQAHVDRIRQLETRAAAGWVAQNQLVEMRLGLRPAANQSIDQELLDRSWRVDVRSQTTNDPDLVQVQIAVSESSAETSSATLTGFIDVGGTNMRVPAPRSGKFAVAR